jgi:hypothetical protein
MFLELIIFIFNKKINFSSEFINSIVLNINLFLIDKFLLISLDILYQ